MYKVEGHGDLARDPKTNSIIKLNSKRKRTQKIFMSVLKETVQCINLTNFMCLGSLPLVYILGCIFGGDFNFTWMVLRAVELLSCVWWFRMTGLHASTTSPNKNRNGSRTEELGWFSNYSFLMKNTVTLEMNYNATNKIRTGITH